MEIFTTNACFISVIIPTYNRNDLLEKCLINLAPGKQTLNSSLYEVIVTDDSKEKKAESFIKNNYSWAKWVAGSYKGPAANRNNGAKQAKGSWFVFIDDDCIPDINLIEEYFKAIRNNNNYEVFEGRTYVNTPRKSLSEVSPINETGGYLWSCNFCIKKTLFEELNGFDERFPYACMEDVDLKLRLTNTNNTFKFIKEAAVLHPWRLKNTKKKGGKNNLHESTLIYLSIHPEENRNINSIYFFKWVLISFFKDTIPGIFKYKGSGLKTALQEHFSYIKMALILFKR